MKEACYFLAGGKSLEIANRYLTLSAELKKRASALCDACGATAWIMDISNKETIFVSSYVSRVVFDMNTKGTVSQLYMA